MFQPDFVTTIEVGEELLFSGVFKFFVFYSKSGAINSRQNEFRINKFSRDPNILTKFQNNLSRMKTDSNVVILLSNFEQLDKRARCHTGLKLV